MYIMIIIYILSNFSKYQDIDYTLKFLSFIFFLGFIDDLYGIKPIQKFLCQLMISLLFIIFLDVFFIRNFYEQVFYSLLLILFINSANTIDGVDGLLGSISIITLLSLYFVSEIVFLYNEFIILMFILIILTSLNLPNAKIYFGDSGAYLIAFIIFFIFVKVSPNDNLLEKSIYINSIFVFPIPIIDFVWAIFRRTYNKKNIFFRDNKHIHHVLLKKTGSKWKTLIILSSLHFILIYWILF